MTDLTSTIIAKSDQMNADDLLGRSQTIKITKVSLLAGEQPIAIDYEGDEGKPWKPCKSMRRVLVGIWGADGNAYIGRTLTLYRDDKVIYGGAEVGGIRISHMSHIDKPVTMVLTATKKSKKPITVKPLAAVTPATSETPDKAALIASGEASANAGTAELKSWWQSIGGAGQKLIADQQSRLKEIAAEYDAMNDDEGSPI